MFKYYLAERFSNSGISRTPKLPQIRPGKDPYLIRLFSRLPHLMRFLSLEFYYKNCMKPITKSVIHSVTYGWNYRQNKYFFSLLGPPGTPSRKRIPRLWVSGPYFESLLTYSYVCFWLFKTCKCIHTYCECCASSIQRILYKRK